MFLISFAIICMYYFNMLYSRLTAGGSKHGCNALYGKKVNRIYYSSVSTDSLLGIPSNSNCEF